MRRRTQLALVLLVSLAISVSLAAPSVVAAQEKPWKSGESIELVLATGGTGGTYFPLGGGIAKLWKDAIPGLNVTVQATGASVANIRLLGKREADLALVQNDTADYGRTGRESFARQKRKIHQLPGHCRSLSGSCANRGAARQPHSEDRRPERQEGRGGRGRLGH